MGRQASKSCVKNASSFLFPASVPSSLPSVVLPTAFVVEPATSFLRSFMCSRMLAFSYALTLLKVPRQPTISHNPLPQTIIKPLKSIPHKRQIQLRLILLPQPLNRGTVRGRVVVLVDLVDREVGGVDGRLEVGFEGRVDLAQLFPDDAAEEGVVFDLDGAVLALGGAEAVVDVAEESVEGRVVR